MLYVICIAETYFTMVFTVKTAMLQLYSRIRKYSLKWLLRLHMPFKNLQTLMNDYLFFIPYSSKYYTSSFFWQPETFPKRTIQNHWWTHW